MMTMALRMLDANAMQRRLLVDVGPTVRWLAIAFTAVSLSALFAWGVSQQWHLNTDMHAADQSAYLDYAEGIVTDAYTGSRNRMPAVPFLLAAIYQPGMPAEDFFQRGKVLGIVLSMAVLALVWLVFSRAGHARDALAATLVAAFTVIVFKAPWVQADVLFYGLALLLFVLLVTLLQRPDPRVAIAAGTVAALAHLTKASVLPALALAVAALVLRAVTAWRRGTPAVRQHASCLALLILSFLIVVFPYIQQSKTQFGSYFYNVNTTFYLWYDTWEQVPTGTRADGDRLHWPTTPPDQIPSASRYWRTHTMGQIAQRLGTGVLATAQTAWGAFGYAQFALTYVVLLGAVLLRSRVWRHVTSAPAVVLFIMAYFLIYLCLYGWWVPMGSGPRFALALFLPFLWLVVRVLAIARENETAVPASWVSPIILGLLAIYLLVDFPTRMATTYGGG